MSDHVVDGEASETDTEVELGTSPDSSVLTPDNRVKTSVVLGEAPESDDEINEPKQYDKSDEREIITDHNISTQSTPTKVRHASILHQKLWESNITFRVTLETILQNAATSAGMKLSLASNMLLNVQESMRKTNANLSMARNNLKEIQCGLDEIGLKTALHNVKPS